MPQGKEIYATRDVDRLRRLAAEHGEAIGRYATAILDTPLPWTRMRQVYRLLGLVKKWGPEPRRRGACRRALFEGRGAGREPGVAHMLGRAREESTEPGRGAPGRTPIVIQGRFARDRASEFATMTEAGR